MRPSAGLIALALFLSLACSDGDSSDGRRGPSAPCKDGSQCEAGLMCFVQTSGQEGGQEGVCMLLPKECGDAPQCTGDCFDAFKAQNCPQGASCVRIGTAVTLS